MLLHHTWAKRALTVAAGAALIFGASPMPAQAAVTLATPGAITFSTTGAVGEAMTDGTTSGHLLNYDLYASDPLEDGHCARWQRKIGNGDWTWIGSSSCGARKKVADGVGKLHYMYRICRTGVGNCSRADELP
ncbi:hypothetical protein [Krasilnikovia sp. M28-CT-15]|uniref:hypothetical protein n=1 Tax=Krasilnikovia sp. M28-CT-15 TaxID=3373540 RepID=UPI00387639E2